MATITEKKQALIEQIMGRVAGPYMPGSGVYQNALCGLQKLSWTDLDALNTLTLASAPVVAEEPAPRVATVYHANTDAIREAGRSGFSGEGIWPEEFTAVARVDVGDLTDGQALGLVFERTNHIDCAWWENPGVERIGPETRSTSVGDVVVLDGQAWSCRSAGWAMLGPFEAERS